MLKQTTNVSGSSKKQILMIFIESVPLKVGVVIYMYTLVSNIDDF